jgi:hypothetical protein
MSVKIDLLPPYVRLRAQRRLLTKIAPLVLAIIAVALAFTYFQMKKNVEMVRSAHEALEERERRTQAAEAATASANQEAAPLQSAVKFMVDAGKTGPERAVLINIIRNYIYEGADVTSIDVSDGRTVKITATVETPDEYANFLYRLRSGSVTNNGTLFAQDPKSSAVTVTNVPVPGGPNDTFIRPAPGAEPVPVLYPLTVTTVGILKDPITIPSESDGASTPAASAGGLGGPAMPGMMPVSPGMGAGGNAMAP